MEPLKLFLSTDQAAAYCQAVLDRTRQPSQALAALTSVPGLHRRNRRSRRTRPAPFTATSSKFSTPTSRRHVPRCWRKTSRCCSPPSAEHNLCDIQRAHAALSRNGFHQTVLAAIERLPGTALLAASDWVAEWRRDAKARAEAASGYPDALDLRGAGIPLGLYAAMSELEMYLQDAVKNLVR